MPPAYPRSRAAAYGCRQVVGILAFSRLRTWGVGKSIPVSYIEEFYVSPPWRDRCIGRSLLNKMVTHYPAKRGSRARVACIIRRHEQQDAAQHLYYKMGMRCKPARRHLVDGQMQPVVLDPRYWGKDDSRESYYEGSEADAAAIIAPPQWADVNSVFKVDTTPIPADTFVRENRAFMLELKRCHDPRHGGDGGDPYDVLAAAEQVYIAYACA